MTVPDLPRSPLAIRLFGPLEIRVNGAPMPRLRSRKGLWLLAMLALRHGQKVERDWLAGLLWPESGQPQALHCLRVTLTDLRRALGSEACRLRSPTRHTLSLDLAGAAVDIVSFEAALRQGDQASLERAVGLYRGPLLEGCTEEWAFEQRQVREQEYLAALEKLAALAVARGQATEAERCLRMAVAADPLRESAQRALMAVLGAGGNYAAALLAYRELRLRLHRELNAEPDPETRALFERLRTEARGGSGASRHTPAPRVPADASKAKGDGAQLAGRAPGSLVAAGSDNGSNGYPARPAPERAPGDEVLRREDGPAVESRPFRRAHGEESNAIGELRPEITPETVAPPPRLPLPLICFFGREAEIAWLRELLSPRNEAGEPRFGREADSGGGRAPGGMRNGEEPALPHSSFLIPHSSRLVTLTGPGGSGKTRLALQVGEVLREPYAGAVWFVPLLDLSDPRLIPDKLLHSLRLPRSSQRDPLERVAAMLSARPSLLILDNFEQLVEGGVGCVQTLLEQVRTLVTLVTSRQCLGVPGEREFPVAPLPVPAGGVGCRMWGVGSDKGGSTEPYTPHPIPHTVMQYPSVQLFADRAQAVQADFQLTAGNAAVVAGLCQRLEGIPLAIELAAARVRVLTPAQMLERLEPRFELLVGRRRAGDPRHHSLRVTLDWSYQLLSPELQRFFARLSVFRGGWTLAAAAAVCKAGVGRQALGVGEAGSAPTPSPQRPTPALDHLEELRQCSLVLTELVGEEVRYRLLETLREYGAEQLTAEERTALAERHLDYYRDRYENEKYLPGVGGRTIQQRLDEVEREHDNLRAALDWWVQSGTALDWMRQTENPSWAFVRLMGYFWLVRGYTTEGRQRLAEILALPGAAVPTWNRAWLLLRAGELARQQADFGAADALAQESLAIYKELGGKRAETGCCRTLADVARDQGDYARARWFHERHLALAREKGSECEIARALYETGYTAHLEGDLETAQSLLEESLQILRKGQEIAWARAHPGAAAGDPDEYAAGGNHLEAIAWARAYLGEVADTRGDHDAAHAYLEESLAHFREFGRLSHSASMLHKLGRVAQHQSQWSAAAAHFGESLAFWQQDGNRQGIAACLEGLGVVASGRGEPERAARLLGAAASLRESRSIPLSPFERADLERVIAGVRVALGEKMFALAWADGQAAPVDQVIAAALEGAPAG